MTHDWQGIVLILVVAIGSAALLSLAVGFYESRQAAKTAFVPLLLLCLTVGILQIVAARHIPWVVGAACLLAVGWGLRRRKSK